MPPSQSSSLTPELLYLLGWMSVVPGARWIVCGVLSRAGPTVALARWSCACHQLLVCASMGWMRSATIGAWAVVGWCAWDFFGTFDTLSVFALSVATQALLVEMGALQSCFLVAYWLLRCCDFQMMRAGVTRAIAGVDQLRAHRARLRQIRESAAYESDSSDDEDEGDSTVERLMAEESPPRPP